jgi:hypothetical protein
LPKIEREKMIRDKAKDECLKFARFIIQLLPVVIAVPITTAFAV